MKLGRHHRDVPTPTTEDISFCFDLAVLLRDGFDGYRRLYDEWEAGDGGRDLRAAALTMTRRNAAYARLGFVSGERLHANLSERLSPFAALRVLCLLNYALVCLGEEKPDPAAVMSPAALDALLHRDEVDAWLHRVLDKVPSDWSVA